MSRRRQRPRYITLDHQLQFERESILSHSEDPRSQGEKISSSDTSLLSLDYHTAVSYTLRRWVGSLSKMCSRCDQSSNTVEPKEGCEAFTIVSAPLPNWFLVQEQSHAWHHRKRQASFFISSSQSVGPSKCEQ
jgi:hypothetical protein